MKAYRHTQIGWAIIVPVLLVFAGVLVMTAFPAGKTGAIPLVAAFVVVVLSLFSTLNVTVTEDWVQCRFGIGLIRRNIHLVDVQRVEAVRNKWYYGWGIRLTPHGWLWNVSGLDAIELTFTDGRKFRIGTDDPERLLEAIRANQVDGNRPA